MTVREQSIFLRGIAVGMKASTEFETDLPANTSSIVAKSAIKKRKSFGKKNSWTELEDGILRNHIHLKNREIMELLPNRSESAIVSRKVILGLKMPRLEVKKEEYPDGIAKLGQEL